MNAELKSKIETYLKKSKATVGKEIIKALRDDYIYLENLYEKIRIDYNILKKDYNKKQVKEENIKPTVENTKLSIEIDRLKDIITSRDKEVNVLKHRIDILSDDNDNLKRLYKFYKIGFYSSLAIIVLLGLLLVA